LLLGRIAAGEMGLFDAFVDRYKGRLFAYIRGRVADGHRAEDLTQEVFLRVFRAGPRHGYCADQQASVATWLFTIARNCITDDLRAHARQPVTLLDDVPAATRANHPPQGKPGDDPQARAIGREDRHRLHSLLVELPVEQAEVVAMKVWGELTCAEIAEVTGAPLATVKSRLAYGLSKLARTLSQQERSHV
jgi:RNA polymerase sigma-70 factor (ECF subfamily)